MVIETERDRAIFLDASDQGHAEPVIYRITGGAPVEIAAIFTNESEIDLAGAGLDLSVRRPRLTVSEASLPAGAAEGDQVAVRGSRYRVAVIEPDGTGFARISLEAEG